ncbi:hypothetical protein LTR91_000005 [Friedmanniomyces endolithicus]|uniref:Uncharacterized protein n=1 Tax=Friedmanniomyces endolithicus TaxID=329885 RepID=A0A4V5N7V0_9PEZI|nr:hypothetical protein LTS09_001218 [Friedmanniomyces endolithicus]KAK0292002.1 hypothetical protein LTR35_001430 [Friedmanniomyces endolithicus]KAK0297916.1 hypothetical protein LTS00_003454 [Friedmanniomyces endolithicus]KAK0310006.1 hypothetical protein LTR01_004204 [Friedmanniomyces endolithicus]KAK0319887.1 hypothetical protein LTR82_009223 [Friedmanniomyces endolithicus]
MPPRPPHDPFTTTALRPTTVNPALRAQTSQQSLRSETSTTSSRTRQQPRDLFAPTLSRRPTSRANPRVAADDVLADPADSEEEARQARKTRLGSPPPELKYSRRRGRAAAQEEDGEIVVRRANGEFLLDGSKADEALEGEMGAPELVAEREEANADAYYAAVARQYFTSGMAMGGRVMKKPEDDPEEQVVAMMAHLRRSALRKLDEERWLVEPLDRSLPRFH